jgi:hypothetical protein
MRKAPERLLHKAVAAYLNAVLPTSVFWTTIPAGGGGKIRGAMLKSMGYKAGTPDILMVHNGLAYWIELKAPGCSLSDAQRHVSDLLLWASSPMAVCKSIDQVEVALRVWRIPTLEHRRAA